MLISEKQKRAALQAAFAHYVMDAGYPYGSGHAAAALGLRMTNENTAAKTRMPQSGRHATLS